MLTGCQRQPRHAETTAREMGIVSLDEALDLVCLIAEKAPARLDGYARRFVARLADERALRLAELDIAVTALRALPSPRAEKSLRALVGERGAAHQSPHHRAGRATVNRPDSA